MHQRDLRPWLDKLRNQAEALLIVGDDLASMLLFAFTPKYLLALRPMCDQLTMTISLSYLSLTAFLVSLGAAHFAYLVIWRLYYSPLSRFPGSQLAAATGWYEFYYDFFHNGKYIFEIERMHNVYGELSCTVIEISTRLG